MIDFSFVGTLPASKSIFNRALVIQSFKPDIELLGDTDADDVQKMRLGLRAMQAGERIDCGDAGTVLRFLSLRAAKLPGEYILTGTKRLMTRPHGELLRLLKQLGCDVRLDGQNLCITSYGWRPQGDCLLIEGRESSQVASGLFLSAWGLKAPLHVSISPNMVSETYFYLTVEMLRTFGMDLQENLGEWTIAAAQVPSSGAYEVELDISSAFSVAAMAVVGGEARIRSFPEESMQPDARFVEYFNHMGIPVLQKGSELKVSRAGTWKGLEVDLKNSPDLFPVLSVLCALGSSPSIIKGIRHLSFKESDRLKKSFELLRGMGAKLEQASEEIVIIRPTEKLTENFSFNPDRDHRMAMAAAVAQRAGYNIEIKTPDVVKKSFPEFWQITGGQA